MNYRDYREGKLDAYYHALFLVSEATEKFEGEEALKWIRERLEHHAAFNSDELERLEKQEGATK